MAPVPSLHLIWHPIKLAGEAAMTDLVTDGRLELGIARGAYSYEYERLIPGLDAWQAGQRMRETTPLLRKLWQGDFAHEGEFYQFPSTTTAPKPVQDGGPPIWIAARDPNSHEFAVHGGFNVQVTPLWQGIEEIETLMQRFNDACATYDGTKPKICCCTTPTSLKIRQIQTRQQMNYAGFTTTLVPGSKTKEQ